MRLIGRAGMTRRELLVTPYISLPQVSGQELCGLEAGNLHSCPRPLCVDSINEPSFSGTQHC